MSRGGVQNWAWKYFYEYKGAKWSTHAFHVVPALNPSEKGLRKFLSSDEKPKPLLTVLDEGARFCAEKIADPLP